MNSVSDRDLLRRFEPVLRFTKGEQFFPMDVEPYVRWCSLWVQRQDRPAQQLIAPGELTLETLGQPYADEFGAVRYLKMNEPLSVREMTEYTVQQRLQHPWQSSGDAFHAGPGRLARVGFLPRLIDAIFSLSLLARGRVPGDTALAALHAYQRIRSQDERYRYYGRVVRQNQWIVLQYWFFYSFNNWRSGFYGANDHESDWEMICLYLTENEVSGDVQPAWVAYASHDYQGDDLRRRWDDPEVTKVGEHPVVHVGAGSHASYYRAGEYLTEIEIAAMARLVRSLEPLQKFWRKQLRQYGGNTAQTEEGHSFNIFSIPFVDYARGDGFCLGPDQQCEWDEPGLLEPTPAWVNLYRGLWGLYARDPFAGEDAPAGPMFNRDGSVRRSWFDPVGWAGLDKVVPPDENQRILKAQQVSLAEEQQQLASTIEAKAKELQGLGIRAEAMRDQPHLRKLYAEYQQLIVLHADRLTQLRQRHASNGALLDAIAFRLSQLRAGDLGPLRAHIRRAHEPASTTNLRRSRLAELWAALSIGIMMVVFVALFYFARQYLSFALVAAISFFTFLEASVRGQVTRLVTSVAIGLSVVSALIIFYEFFWTMIVVAVLVAGVYVLWDNVQELRR